MDNMSLKMDNILSFEQKPAHDWTKMEGSCVDFFMLEDEIPNFPDHKAILREDKLGNRTGLGIVGRNYPLTTHTDFFARQHEMFEKKFPAGHLENAEISYQTSRKGAFALMNLILPDVKLPIETSKHKTEVGLRHVSWHGVDGGTSNNSIFGAIDFFCTNGIITGEYERIRKKNTKNFDMRKFIDEIEKSVEEFYVTARKYQAWAARDISYQDAENVIESLPIAKRNKPKLLTIYEQEVMDRGSNLWALYSAFTNYSSHTDNGFPIRQTGGDHQAETMLKREFSVVSWLDNEEFVRLAA